MENAFYLHSLDPFAIQFTETFGIRWYSLAYMSGFIVGYLTFLYFAKRKLVLFTEEMCSDVVVYCALGVMLGGRIGYVLFYSPELLWQFESSFPFWGALAVHKGGMASHGGVAGVMFVCWLYAKKHKIPWLHMLDLTVLGGAIGFFFGRLANFINGELYGRASEPGYPWAVKFPSEIHRWIAEGEWNKVKSLAPAIEALGAKMKYSGGQMVAVTQETWQRWVDALDWQNMHRYSDQLLSAVTNDNQAVINALAPVLTPRYPSQLYQAVLEGLLVFLILLFIWYKPRKVGVLSGWFGILYALARIIGEQYRLPDQGIGFQLFGLTRGQWLSFGMLAAGVAILIYAIKSKSQKYGGWGIRSNHG